MAALNSLEISEVAASVVKSIGVNEIRYIYRPSNQPQQLLQAPAKLETSNRNHGDIEQKSAVKRLNRVCSTGVRSYACLAEMRGANKKLLA